MVIFWLSAMGNLAATRVAFNIPVDIYNYKAKRYLYVWATQMYLDIMAATAGIAGLEV